MSDQKFIIESLLQRVARLESVIKKMPSHMAATGAGGAETLDVEQTAHGFALGDVVIQQAGDWKTFSPALYFDIDITGNDNFGTVGIIDRVTTANKFTVRLSGVGPMPSFDILDDPIEDGSVLYASDTNLGEITRKPQMTGIRIGYKVGENKCLLMPGRTTNSNIQFITTSVTAPAWVDLLNGTLASAPIIGAAANPRLGFVVFNFGAYALAALSGAVEMQAQTALPNGDLYLDPDNDGEAINTIPVVPDGEDWLPLKLGRHENGFLFIEPTQPIFRIADLSDVSGTPGNDQVLKWDDTDKKWRPGDPGLPTEANGPSIIAQPLAGLADVVAYQATSDNTLPMRVGGVLAWAKVAPAQMENRAAYSILANVNASAGSLAELSAKDGTVLGRVGSTMLFGSNPQLGTALGGLGYIKIWFAPNKYFEVDSSGKTTIYHSATQKVEILADSTIKATWGNSNTVELNPAHIVDSGRAFRFREIDVCDPTGAAKKLQGLFTELY